MVQTRTVSLSLLVWTMAVSAHASRTDSRAPALRIEEVGSDSTAFHVVSTLVIGPTEVIAWDAQYHVSDASRLADRIAATRCRLKAIVISHPDEDHFMGAATLVERFPGTPVYMTPAAIEVYKKVGPQMLSREKARGPGGPDSLVTAVPLPTNHLTVDGTKLEVIPDLSGDVLQPTNSAIWIPSLRTVLAGDVVFNGVHPWLGNSDESSRERWQASLKTIRDLHPDRVVAGHKRDVAAPDTPETLTFMNNYLTDFEAMRGTASDAGALQKAMMQKYGDLAVPGLLWFSAQTAFHKA
jgi:glyoxylase-like metal-dependent hydrolase (beta-lactamase superfamily II)